MEVDDDDDDVVDELCRCCRCAARCSGRCCRNEEEAKDNNDEATAERWWEVDCWVEIIFVVDLELVASVNPLLFLSKFDWLAASSRSLLDMLLYPNLQSWIFTFEKQSDGLIDLLVCWSEECFCL